MSRQSRLGCSKLDAWRFVRNLGRYSELVTILDLRTIKIRSGEQFRDLREVELEPLQLAGQRYIPLPETPEVEIAVSRVTSGRLFELAFPGPARGPLCGVSPTRLSSCLSGLGSTTQRIRGTPTSSPTPYIEDDKLGPLCLGSGQPRP